MVARNNSNNNNKNDKAFVVVVEHHDCGRRLRLVVETHNGMVIFIAIALHGTPAMVAQTGKVKDTYATKKNKRLNAEFDVTFEHGKTVAMPVELQESNQLEKRQKNCWRT
jgi:hypothetical protein